MTLNISSHDFRLNSKPITWRYDAATSLIGLVAAKKNFYEAKIKSQLESVMADIYSIDTCNSLGVIIWAKILDLPINIVQDSNGGNENYVGFSDERCNFFLDCNFGAYDVAAPPLFISEARLALKMRYWKLVSPCVMYIDNIFLQKTFDGGVVLRDNKNMTLTALWDISKISLKMINLFIANDLFPRGAGVGVTQQQIIDALGFGDQRQNFHCNFSVGC